MAQRSLVNLHIGNFKCTLGISIRQYLGCTLLNELYYNFYAEFCLVVAMFEGFLEMEEQEASEAYTAEILV